MAHAANQPAPPGGGITQRGVNPEGQPSTPPGFNAGLDVYRDCVGMAGPTPGLETYPPCTGLVTDRCRQTYTRWARSAGPRPANIEGRPCAAAPPPPCEAPPPPFAHR